MSGWSNYSAVLEQLEAAGIILDAPIQIDRFIACRTLDKPKRKKGWYILHEYLTRTGVRILTGAYGDYRDGNSKGQRIEIDYKALTPEEKTDIRKKIREDQRTAEKQQRYQQARAADRAKKLFGSALTDGEHPYLIKKQVRAHGLRFTSRGDALVPMCDEAGRLWGVQVLYGPDQERALGRNKTYWPAGCRATGTFHIVGTLGECSAAPDVLLIAEGYATAAALYESTGIACVVAFSAGNLKAVGEALRKIYPRARFLFCADDDYQSQGNPGVTAARQAAYACSGDVLVPEFSDRGTRKWTDFNDLLVAEGSGAVRAQVLLRINDLGWGGEHRSQYNADSGIDVSVDALLKRFVVVLRTETAFCTVTHKIWTVKALRTVAQDNVSLFLKSPRRRVVDEESIVFDPVGRHAGRSVCNIWSGWPTVPKKGKCTALLDLLEYLCQREAQSAPGLFEWVVSWLAYPIQNPGAKLQTALLLHGPQGTGKNTFFSVIKSIYGKYGGYFGQDDLEDRWNDWLSGRLFMIGNEVVGRRELYNVPGKIKAMITEDEHLIRSRFVSVRSEANHTNFVFLSNEATPLVIDNDDRRLAVIHTPPKLEKSFYEEVGEEIADGSVEALHHYLLEWDYGANFSPHSDPPMTDAKQALIDVSADSTEGFIADWMQGNLDPMVPNIPGLSEDVYRLYRKWCFKNGFSKPVPLKYMVGKIRMIPGWESRRVNYATSLSGRKTGTFVVPAKRGIVNPGQTQEVYFGECVTKFRSAVDEFCGRAQDGLDG